MLTADELFAALVVFCAIVVLVGFAWIRSITSLDDKPDAGGWRYRDF
jgi:hypothetical protein